MSINPKETIKIRSLKFWTCSYKTLNKSYQNTNWFDVTVKGKDSNHPRSLGVFAPQWSYVMDHKNGKITDQQYTNLYIADMRKSYVTNHEQWKTVLKTEHAVFVCYCPTGKFCHRHILKDILVSLGAEFQNELY